MNISELRELWLAHDFHPRKRLGQNFLIDRNTKEKILGAVFTRKSSTIIEIGTGFCNMTFDLAAKCKTLFTIEKDPRICQIIDPLLKQRENIRLICADVLELDLCKFVESKENLVVFGNIPYYISTPLIERLIAQRGCIDSIFLVMQEELVDRIVSLPASREYGSISCFVQFYTKANKLFRIKNSVFTPRPMVASSLLRLDILRTPAVEVKDEALMFKIIRKAFSERRKKAVNALARNNFLSMDRNAWFRVFKTCKIDASSRAENLALSDYAKICNSDLIKVY